MLKLPDASDKKKGDTCTKKRDRPDKRGVSLAFSSAQRSANSLLTSGGRHVFVFKRRIG